MRNDGKQPTSLGTKVLLVIQIVLYTFWLKLVNLWSRQAITGDCDVDVSLTTYGVRTRRVWRAIETIGRGTVLPRSVVLWHEDRAIVDNPPRSLRRLQRRGLQIKHCPDYGPHKKYFPHIMEQAPKRPLVTADDDVFYPRSWLVNLVAAHHANEVTAYRSRIMGDGPYDSWPLCTSTKPSDSLLATGVSGVMYPPRVLIALRERGDRFMQVCPRADDLWLHYAAVATGVPTRQVSEIAAKWWPVRPKERGLWHQNLVMGGNDAVTSAVAEEWPPSATSELQPLQERTQKSAAAIAPKVSVITPTYNCEKYVHDAIASVQGQSYSNWEMIIVDDCSTDATCDIVARLAQSDPRIRLLRQPTNAGAGPARTLALENASGRFIAYLDADDIWYPDKLERQLEFMLINNYGFSCSSYEVIDDKGSRLNKSIRMLPKVQYIDFLTNNLLQTVGIVVDTDIVDRDLLRMPPLKRRQDAATWLQILKAGHANYGLIEVLGQYRRTENSLSSNKFKASKGVWTLYRDVENLSLAFSCYCFARYAVLAVWKRVYL